MAQFRDLQKLRQTKNPIRQSPIEGRSTRMERFKPEMEAFGINLNKVLKIQHQTPQKGHRKGLSINGFTFYNDKRQIMTPSPILSIYNYSMKMKNDQQPENNFISNVLTSRKDTGRDSSSRREKDQDYLKYKDYMEGKLLNTEVVTKSWFKMGYVVGKGGFGKVWKVEMKRNGKVYAMKEMYKTKIIEKKSINSIMNEKNLLSRMKHQFLVNMSYAFQDRQNIYLVMDYLNGGDLRYHIGKRRKFSQNQTKFFIVCILLALQYLHANKVIHRDIKPQNLVLESNGYVRITDLGISRQWREDNANDTSGTPGYMAPEVMCRKNHSFSVDYFAVGVIGYEFMLGRRPYLGKNRKEIRDQILAKQAEIKPEDIPKNWSFQGADFINKLLIRNPHYRMGAGGIQQIKQHPWLKNIDWMRLQKKELKAPYIPICLEDNYDEYKKQISEDTVIENPQQNALLLRDRQIQELFDGYYFDIEKGTKKTKSTSYTTNGSVINTQMTDGQAINYKGFMESSRR